MATPTGGLYYGSLSPGQSANGGDGVKVAVLSLIGSEHSGGRKVSVRQMKGQRGSWRRCPRCCCSGLSRSDNSISLTSFKLAGKAAE